MSIAPMADLDFDAATDFDFDAGFDAAVRARTGYTTADFASTRPARQAASPSGRGRRSGRPGGPARPRPELYDRWRDASVDVPARHPLAAADLEEEREFPLHEDTDLPTLRLVEQRRRLAKLAGVSRRRWTVAAAIVLVGFAIVMVNVALHVEMARAQFRLTDLQRREAAAEKAYDQKRLEVAKLEAPQRVIDEARAQGMVEATNVKPVHAAPATPAPGPAPDQAASTTRPSNQSGWQQLKPQLQRGATK